VTLEECVHAESVLVQCQILLTVRTCSGNVGRRHMRRHYSVWWQL